MIRTISILVVFLLIGFQHSMASNVVVRELDKNWCTYDEGLGVLVPILDIDIKRSQSLTQRIDISNYENDCLTFRTSKGMCFFVNNQLYSRYDSVYDVVIPFSSMVKGSNQKLQFTFFHKYKKLPYRQISIIKNHEIINSLISTNSRGELTPIRRDNGPFKSLLIVSLILELIYNRKLTTSKAI